jgi:hypothetical protein
MSIDLKKLEINVNLHSLQPNFLNSELHYVIASDENSFRFATWEEEPKWGEKKYYCFLTEQPLFIPSGNITLAESYTLIEEPVYPVVANCNDFIATVEAMKEKGVAKCIRQFSDKQLEEIKEELEKKYSSVEQHKVKSGQGQHLLLVFDNYEISVSAAMVYFRYKAPFSDAHYEHVKEEATNTTTEN